MLSEETVRETQDGQERLDGLFYLLFKIRCEYYYSKNILEGSFTWEDLQTSSLALRKFILIKGMEDIWGLMYRSCETELKGHGLLRHEKSTSKVKTWERF